MDVTGRVYTPRSPRAQPDRAQIARGYGAYAARARKCVRRSSRPARPGQEAKAIDHCEPEAAWRYGVMLGLLVLVRSFSSWKVTCTLVTSWSLPDLCEQCGGGCDVGADMATHEQRHPHMAGVRLASYSAADRGTRLPTPMPLRLVIGLEKTGNTAAVGHTDRPRGPARARALVVNRTVFRMPASSVGIRTSGGHGTCSKCCSRQGSASQIGTGDANVAGRVNECAAQDTNFGIGTLGARHSCEQTTLRPKDPSLRRWSAAN